MSHKFFLEFICDAIKSAFILWLGSRCTHTPMSWSAILVASPWLSCRCPQIPLLDRSKHRRVWTRHLYGSGIQFCGCQRRWISMERLLLAQIYSWIIIYWKSSLKFSIFSQLKIAESTKMTRHDLRHQNKVSPFYVQRFFLGLWVPMGESAWASGGFMYLVSSHWPRGGQNQFLPFNEWTEMHGRTTYETKWNMLASSYSDIWNNHISDVML